jgi:putative CocE/NonD family hydrolase
MTTRSLPAALILSLAFAPAVIAQSPPFTVEKNVLVPMPDGVRLATDLYIPNPAAKVPAILVRTPYDRSQFSWLGQPLAAHGYVVVVQDARGTGASEGALEPFIHERSDGVATVRWIARQPWSNGRIGLWGTSYLAFAGLMIAAEKPPEVGAMVALSGWGDVRRMLYPGDALQLLVTLGWNLSQQISGRKISDWPAVFQTIPVDSIPAKFGARREAWNAVAALIKDPTALEQTSLGRASLEIPILHITGWNDFLVNDALAVYANAVRGAGGARQKLIVGPWAHDQVWGPATRVGDEDFGSEAALGGEKVVELTVRWFDHWLKGEETGITRDPPVRYFMMDANQWRTSDAWPPRESRTQEWFLDSAGRANSAAGDGRLVAELPRKKTSDGFIFDPLAPVPTAGGANFHHFPEFLGPRDQRAVEERTDVLVYTSAPLESSLQIAGPIDVEVYASTEGVATDFTAKLVEVRADGYARIIADGIRRVKKADLRKPIIVTLGHTAMAIPKGSRLRLEVSSSNFPKYARNPNTGETPESAIVFKKVGQRIDHGGRTPSRVRLAVLPAGK